MERKSLQQIIKEIPLSSSPLGFRICVFWLWKRQDHRIISVSKNIYFILSMENPNFSKCCLITEYIFSKLFHILSRSDACDWWRRERCLIIAWAWAHCGTCFAVKCAPRSGITLCRTARWRTRQIYTQNTCLSQWGGISVPLIIKEVQCNERTAGGWRSPREWCNSRSLLACSTFEKAGT